MLADVTNLPTISPGGSQDDLYGNVEVAILSAPALHLPTPRATG